MSRQPETTPEGPPRPSGRRKTETPKPISAMDMVPYVMVGLMAIGALTVLYGVVTLIAALV